MGGHSTSPATLERIDAGRLREFTKRIFVTCGMPPSDADLLTDHLIWASLRGIPMLGVHKIPSYVDGFRAGTMKATGREPKVVSERGGFLVVDAEHAFGQVAGCQVMHKVIETAQSCGVGAAVIRNTNSGGALGYYPALAVEKRMIGLAMNNSEPLQTAPGGAENVIGNQAWAVASPAGKHPPLVLDMATSAMSLARIHEYEQRGELLPEGVALAADGTPTRDPVAALEGMLLPMAGHRGFGLALLWEVLTGVLAGGSALSTDVPSATFSPADGGQEHVVSMFMLAIDPTVSLPYEVYVSRVDELLDRMHASQRADGSDPLRLPGQRGASTMAQYLTERIPIPHTLLAKLREVAGELGVSDTV